MTAPVTASERDLRALARIVSEDRPDLPADGGLPESLLADEPVRDFSFIGLFNGAPELSERSEEILREEFTKRADADR